MKLKLFVFSILMLGGFTIHDIPAQLIGPFYSYEVRDICGVYGDYQGCGAIVKKCRPRGVDICVVFEQIPCEEACAPRFG